MTFSMRLPTGKSKQKPLAAPFASKSKQYGLLIPLKDSVKQESRKSLNVFAAAAEKSKKEKIADSKENAKCQKEIESTRSVHACRVDKLHALALAEDASVFDYDAVYDDMKSARAIEAGKSAAKREDEKKRPKYISTLLQQAKIREVENERIRERRLLNERKADDVLYGDKEKLVSASYKRKLQEMQRWDAEDARLAEVEEREDVVKQAEHGIAGFYANLNKNIAMGGSTDNARSAYTAHGAPKIDRIAAVECKHEREHENAERATIEKFKDTSAPEQTAQSDEDCQSQSVHDAIFKHKEIAALCVPQNDVKEAKISKQDAIAAAKARFLARQAQRKTRSK
ncbi:hypothetical protein CCR75_007742 [Bremia lactucae]|uniref:Nuclear speckle splicing regulatory protein 1 N-terminal domain-containing protein n=1 Tax=Bremia lactucae TaxID=4779 RepID=A0A976FH34_BRELC|nr:hypothetical protein CCR75_007742 [Bremia lactucae]